MGCCGGAGSGLHRFAAAEFDATAGRGFAASAIPSAIKEATKIELVAVGNKPQPRGKAIYQRRNRNLIFFASNLPPLPAEKVYALWLFPANGGAPIAAGLFKPDARGSATVVNPPLPAGGQAKNFAVTLEPESSSHLA